MRTVARDVQVTQISIAMPQLAQLALDLRRHALECLLELFDLLGAKTVMGGSHAGSGGWMRLVEQWVMSVMSTVVTTRLNQFRLCLSTVYALHASFQGHTHPWQ